MSTFYNLMLTVGTGGGTPYEPPPQPVLYSRGVFIYNDNDMISSAMVMDNANLHNKNIMFIFSGGIANNTIVSKSYYNAEDFIHIHGVNIDDGGTANSTTVSSGGVMRIFDGGMASMTTVSSGGVMRILDGGMASMTTVSSGGYMQVSSGCTATGTTVYSGGMMYVFSGGTALNVTSRSGAVVSVYQGGTITYA